MARCRSLRSESTYRTMSIATELGVANCPRRLRSIPDRVASSSCRLQSQFCQIVNAMLPNPVEHFRSLIAEVVAAEVAAKEQDERDRRSIRFLELMDFRCLFLAALVRVREVARGFRFDQD